MRISHWMQSPYYCLISCRSPKHTPDEWTHPLGKVVIDHIGDHILFHAVCKLNYELNDNGWETDEIVACDPIVGSDAASYLNFNLPDSALCVLPAFWNSTHEELDVPVEGEEDTLYVVGYANYIQAQLSAVSIMTLATGGRMTLRRLWRLAMKLGWNKHGSSIFLRLPGIDYEKTLLVHEALDMAKQAGTRPNSIPQSYIIRARELGDVALVKQFLMKRAGLSFWMRPDRFPLTDEDGTEHSCPSFVGAPSSMPTQHRLVEALPHELLVQISCQLPLSSVFSLCSSSRALRHELLAFESDRNSLARQWIATAAPWYLPQIYNSELSSVPGVTWAYLMQCLRSGSMRNRQRIWEMALKLERRADEMHA